MGAEPDPGAHHQRPRAAGPAVIRRAVRVRRWSSIDIYLDEKAFLEAETISKLVPSVV